MTKRGPKTCAPKKVQIWRTKSWPERGEFSGGWRACSINIPSLADRWMDPWGETWRRACEKSFRRLNLKLFSFRLFSDIEILKKVKWIPDTWSMIGMLEMEMFKSWIFPVNRASAQFETFPFPSFWMKFTYLGGWKLSLNLNQTETRNLMLASGRPEKLSLIQFGSFPFKLWRWPGWPLCADAARITT